MRYNNDMRYDNEGIYFWANGKLHREDGPAIEYVSGRKEWWFNNICIDSLHLLMITMIGYKE